MQYFYSRIALPASLRQVADETITRFEDSLLKHVRAMAEFIVSLFSHAFGIIIAPILAFYMLRDLTLIRDAFFSVVPTCVNSDFKYLSQEMVLFSKVYSWASLGITYCRCSFFYRFNFTSYRFCFAYRYRCWRI